jgi:glycosyltransferase involved in cell wall biosynthesis
MGTVTFDRPLPIAIVISSFHPGGTERQMIELVRRLDRRRWHVHVVCFRREGAWLDRVSTFADSLVAFPIAGFARSESFAQLRRFARWCRDEGIALVHTTDLYSNIFFLPGAAMARVPVRIGSRREIAAGKSLAQIGAQRAAYACAHRIVANAEAVAARLRREAVRAECISVIPNGLDLSRFAIRMLPKRLRRICMVANMRPGKGHDTLIDAAPAVLARFPDATFDLVGDGPERAALEARVRSGNLDHAFIFAGHVDNVAARLNEADVFVLPSESEAFPNAVLEAMAAGLPTVATAVGGVTEVVQHGQTGLLVPPRHAEALAEALCGLLAVPHEARRLAGNARELVTRRYSFDRMVAAAEDMYEHELARRAPERAVQSQFAPL